jgi:site-specific DNA-methyltransferase (adenine-specific)
MSDPYYADEAVTLYHGDCADVLPSLAGVDLIVTSPPYNLGVTPGGGFGHYKDGQRRGGQGKWSGTDPTGIDYTDHVDAMPYTAYQYWQMSVLELCWNTLSDTGAIFYNHKPRVQASVLWTPLELNPGLPLRQIIVWSRSGGTNFALTHYVPTYEWLMVLAKPAFRLKSKGASGVGDVWRVPQESNPDHPAPFPVGIPARAIETTSPALVLDPFAGGGTTLRAAKDAGVRSIGIEKSERYCETAAKRLSQGVLDFGEVS